MKKLILDNMHILVIASIALSVIIIIKMRKGKKHTTKTKNFVIANAEPETVPADGDAANE